MASPETSCSPEAPASTSCSPCSPLLADAYGSATAAEELATDKKLELMTTAYDNSMKLVHSLQQQIETLEKDKYRELRKANLYEVERRKLRKQQQQEETEKSKKDDDVVANSTRTDAAAQESKENSSQSTTSQETQTTHSPIAKCSPEQDPTSSPIDVPKPDPSFLLSIECPASPPPTAVYSPLPLQNKIYAGSTPLRPFALSPVSSTDSLAGMAAPVSLTQASQPPSDQSLTPTQTPPEQRTLELEYRRKQSLPFINIPGMPIPDKMYDHDLAAPLTMKENGFIKILHAKLQKVADLLDERERKQTMERTMREGVTKKRSMAFMKMRNEAEATSSEQQQKQQQENQRREEGQKAFNEGMKKMMFDIKEKELVDKMQMRQKMEKKQQKTEVYEQIDGVILKGTRSTNFGAPIGVMDEKMSCKSE